MTDSAKPIETHNLGMIYRQGLFQRPREGLRDLTLSVEPGEIFGYLGANGAGKTTTIKILVGLLFPTSGSATVYGVDIHQTRSRAKVGFLPENPYFYEYLTATESLVFYGQLAGLSRDKARRRTAALLEQVGLSSEVDTRVKDFSRGMRQRLGLAQAIVHDPSLLLLDEPMGGLDPRGRRDVRDLILSLRDAGKTIFLSSHILGDVEVVCDRVGILRRGALLKSGPLHEIVRAEVTGIEITYAGAGPDCAQNTEDMRARGLSVRVLRTLPEGRVSAEVATQQDADRLLDEVRAHGGHILEVKPQQETLEDVFLSLNEDEDAGEKQPGESRSAPVAELTEPAEPSA